MNSIADGSVIIQTFSQFVPSTPPWFGEVALIIQHLRKQGVLDAISRQMRFARRRFGHYEVIDFVAIRFGYAISGEGTLETFYARLTPFAQPFMALFGRDRLPARSTLARFLAALAQEPVEALRTLFLEDLLARPPSATSARAVGLQIEEAKSGSSSRSMGHVRPPVNGRGLRPQSCLHPSGGGVRGVLPATLGASVGRPSVPARPSRKRIPLSGSAPSATQATATTGRNSVGR